jgi:O-antigen ligase
MLLLNRLRLFLVSFVAISVGLPMAWISLGKLVLFMTCLVYLVSQLIQKKSDFALSTLWTVRLILFTLAAFALSLGWSEAPQAIAVLAFSKHSKILEIVMLICLLRNRQEALWALIAFMSGQAFLLLSSWLMVAGWRVPWATSALMPQYKNVVYSTYLDQTLICSAAAAVFWNFRSMWPQIQWAKSLLAILAIAGVVNVLFFQEGKTGYIAALSAITLAVMWQIPRQWRLAALVIAPLSLGLLAYVGSSKIQERATQIMNESQNYSTHGDNASSSGFRLHAWRRSLQAIAERPLIGHGVGSWAQSVKRIEGAQAEKIFGEGLTGNSHQEFLFWGVELGVGGILLLLLLIASLIRDAMRFEPATKQATFAVIAVMVVACLFNCSLHDALIGDFFCITLGLLLALGIRSSNTDPVSLPKAHTKVSA